jgi:hypothetical protein
MADILVRVLIPYARFREVRARRRHIIDELTRSMPERRVAVAVSSAPAPNEHRTGAAVRSLATAPTAGIQR